MLLLFVAFTSLLAVGGFLIGTRMARPDSPTKTDKRELNRLRDFEAQALALAHEHLAYGDPLATHIINIGRKELS